MNRRLDIAIAGYGIAGAAAALVLGRQGHCVTNFERRMPTEAEGAGLLLHPATLALLDVAGLARAARSCGAPVDRLVATTCSGRFIMDIGYREVDGQSGGCGILRADLLRLLRDAANRSAGVELGRAVVSADPSRGVIQLDDGSTRGPFDLVIVADGSRSSLRGQIPANVRHDREYPHAAVVCVVEDNSRRPEPVLLQSFCGTQHVSVWPVSNRGPGGHRQLNVSLNVPLADAARYVENDEWRRIALRICPWLQKPLDAARGKKPGPIIYAYRDVLLRRHAVGRLAYVGDAAHSMSPQLGLGVRLALQDALALAESVASCDDIAAALGHFAESQVRRVRPIQRLSRILTPFFQSRSRLLAAARDGLAGPVSRFRPVQRGLRRLFAAGESRRWAVPHDA